MVCFAVAKSPLKADTVEEAFMVVEGDNTRLSRFCGSRDNSCEWYNLRLEQRVAEAAQRLLAERPHSRTAGYARATIEFAAAHENYLRVMRGLSIWTIPASYFPQVAAAQQRQEAALGRMEAEYKLMMETR